MPLLVGGLFIKITFFQTKQTSRSRGKYSSVGFCTKDKRQRQNPPKEIRSRSYYEKVKNSRFLLIYHTFIFELLNFFEHVLKTF